MQTNEQLLELYKVHKSAAKVSTALNGEISERTIQRRLKKAFPGYNTANEKDTTDNTSSELSDERPVAGGTITAPDKRRSALAGKRFVFTSAQNNTYVHQGFLDSLKTFIKHKDAMLIVSPFAYNKSGFQNGTKDSDKLWYDPQIEPHFCSESVQVAKGLVFCGELDILPTASNPLSGLGNYTQDASGIVPHAKVQMESLPRMKGEDARFMYTTGAVTQRNYIQRKAGQKAEFHHVFAALYVEVDEQGDWFVRQLIAGEDGTFYDLTNKYTPDGIETDRRPAAITWGDIHLEKIDPVVFVHAWGDSSMLSTLNPAVQFIHDLTDFRARNHHNIEDPFFLAEMHFKGQSNVERDLHRCGAFLEYITRFGNKAVVVESNHDQALKKWLREADIRKDPENAEFYHRANSKIHFAIKAKAEFNVFEWAVTADGTLGNLRNVQFLQEDDSYVVMGIEQGMHGHRGPNGSRGNPRGFRNIGRKVNIGHMHSAGIHDGVYVAGVSGSFDMGYNKGPSSWSHSHIVTYPNGKRTIITMKNGKWRANGQTKS